MTTPGRNPSPALDSPPLAARMTPRERFMVIRHLEKLSEQAACARSKITRDQLRVECWTDPELAEAVRLAKRRH